MSIGSASKVAHRRDGMLANRRGRQPGDLFELTTCATLIQGNMTLRQSRIYLLKLIGRYFELR
jgi:hypothetical protein